MCVSYSHSNSRTTQTTFVWTRAHPCPSPLINYWLGITRFFPSHRLAWLSKVPGKKDSLCFQLLPGPTMPPFVILLPKTPFTPTCPAMDSSTWGTKNLEIWPQTAPLLITSPQTHCLCAWVITLGFYNSQMTWVSTRSWAWQSCSHWGKGELELS
jgi:hypothetical protein